VTRDAETASPSPPSLVIELIARLNIGGPAVLVLDLAAGLDPKEFQVLVAAGKVGPGEAQMDFWAKARNIRWTPVRGLSPALGEGNLSSLRDVFKILSRQKPRILHTHTAKAGTVGRLAALGRGPARPRLVHTFHGHVFRGYFPPLKTRLFLAVERLLARFTDRVVVLSQEQAADICRVFRICREEKVAVIPAGLDLEAFRRAGPGGLKNRLGLGAETFLVGFVGRLTAIKDPMTLLRGMAKARDRSPRPLALVLAGGGEMEAEVKAEAARLGLPAFFLGWREGTADLYPELDLLVLSSRNEGLPLVLIEALAAARPVASTPVGGVPGLLDMGKLPDHGSFTPAQRGLLFPVGDEEGLARAVLWSLEHRPELTRMALAGQSHVLARHGREGFLRAHADLYRDLLGGVR